MAWLGTDNIIQEQATYSFRYQYAIVDAAWKSSFPAQASEFSDGDEVVRRIRQNIITERNAGITKAYASTKMNEYRNDPTYGAATAIWNGAGGYDVTAEKVLVDPDGWSVWINISDLEEFEALPDPEP